MEKDTKLIENISTESDVANKIKYEKTIDILTIIWVGVSLVLAHLLFSASMEEIGGFDKAAADFNVLGKFIMFFTFTVVIAGGLTIPMMIISLFIKNRISLLILWGKRLFKSFIYSVLLIILLFIENFIANLIFVSEKGLI